MSGSDRTVRSMSGRVERLSTGEDGVTLVFVAVGLMAFIATSALAIDVGMFMTARAQAQNAADAGALAGATALVFDSYDDRSAAGPVVQSAINTARANLVMGAPPSVTPSDVSFPAVQGNSSRVRVNVFRTQARSNPIATLVGPLLGVDTVDIWATATAEAAPANAMTCVKPFTIPDRWIENTNPPWTPDSTFDRYDKNGRLLPNADVYVRPSETGYAGYDPYRDKGLRLMIRAGTGNNVAPSFYWSWAMPGGAGADWYRENIANCNMTVIGIGTLMTPEPGNMVGPTIQGIDVLIAKDPDAYWDEATRSVQSRLHPSPRIFPIPLYDPEYYESGKQTGRESSLRMANWLGFFVEGRSGNTVYGRVTPMTGLIDGDAGPAPAGAFPRAIRLVE
jgi:Flp pilus assembly protein TadG